MALLGGGVGGAGNPVGGSFTGPAEALEIIGDHAYAFASVTGTSTSELTRLDFTSGNYYFVGRVTLNGSADTSSVLNGNVTVFVLSFNGTEVMRTKVDTIANDMPTSVYNDIIIPPYTEVKLTSISDDDDATRKTSCSLTGRIYRTRD